jgi:beta-mannanase
MFRTINAVPARLAGPARAALAATLALTTLVVGTMPAAAQPAPIPGAGVYVGAYISGAPFDASLLDHYENVTGKPLSIVHWGQPWVNNGKQQSFQAEAFQRVHDRGSLPMLTWGSWELGKGTGQPNFTLSNIYNGKYDGFINQWAKDAAAWGQPFFLRFDHEMNGTWQFPWAEKINGNQSGDYVKAWRHVHDIFAQQGASNATWVWCPNISGTTTTPLNQLYPGDNYVDWTCMDGYNWGNDTGAGWQSFAQVFGGSDFGSYNPHDTYKELLSIAPSKPIMIGEVASSENGGSKSDWINDMFQTQLPTNFPNIKAVVWEDWNDNDPKLSFPIESSNGSATAYARSVASDYYFANNVTDIVANGPVVATW